MENKIILTIHTDGGSRGNPGPSACGFVIEKNGDEVFSKGVYLGTNTNNYAEYMGVKLSLDWVAGNFDDLKNININYFLDSELLVKQMNGSYKIKSPNLIEIFLSIKKNILNFNKVTFTHVYREKNVKADGLVNESLDENI